MDRPIGIQNDYERMPWSYGLSTTINPMMACSGCDSPLSVDCGWLRRCSLIRLRAIPNAIPAPPRPEAKP